MGETTEILRLLLAAILAVASVAKLWDLVGASQAMRSFGVPAPLARPLAISLAVCEAVIAIALLPAGLARPAAIAATVLFGTFALVVAFARLRGRTPDCHCFGRLHSSPAGWWPIVGRNVGLAVAAAAVASQPASSITATTLLAFGVVALVVGQALVLYMLLRRYGRALARIEQLESGVERPRPLAVGEEAPTFDGLPARGRQALLVFSAPGCGPCAMLLPKVAEWQRELAHVVAVTVVEDGGVADLYGVEMTPSAVLVDADGRIATELALGSAAIEQLVASLTPVPQPAGNGSGRLAIAGAAAGAVVTTAAVAQAAPPTDPELKAIDDLLRAAGPKLVAASQRSLKAIRAQATLKTGKSARAKRAAARRALAAERREVLALRAKIKPLAETNPTAHNVKMMAGYSLSLLAQSLQKRERAIGASPKVALKLADESQKLFLRSLGSSAAAGKLLGRGS